MEHIQANNSLSLIKSSQEDIPKIHMPSRNTQHNYERKLNEKAIHAQRQTENDRPPDRSTEPKKSDWLQGGSFGSKNAVLVFKASALATPSSLSRSKSRASDSSILLNKASFMAKKNLPKDHRNIAEDFEDSHIMQEVLKTYGSVHLPIVTESADASTSEETESSDSNNDEPLVKEISAVLSDLNKITYKKALTIVNTTAKINSRPETQPKPKESMGAKHSNGKATTFPSIAKNGRMDEEWKENVKILSRTEMPAAALRMTYKLVNAETRLINILLQAHGLTEAPAHTQFFNLLWSGAHLKPDLLRSLTLVQRVNHFPRSFELTRKDKLYKNIEKMQYFRGTKQFDFVPMTFLMPSEIKELLTAHYRIKGPWIVKPAASSRGRGIYIVNSPDQIPRDENVVVAKYIDRPLLVGGHKCDLRLYVCVTSIDPLLIYLYEEGLVRFATVKYDKTNKNLWNPCMHLCNYSINKYHSDYIKCNDANTENVGHKWTLSALLRHLRRQSHDTATLMASIEDLIIKSLLSTAHTIAAASRMFVPYFNNCFELYGYDILIDDTLKPWLLEINLSPSLGCDSPLDAKVKSSLLADTLTLVGIPAVEMTSTEVTPPSKPSCKGVGLKMRIGACRRVHSAEILSPTKKSFQVNSGSVSTLTTEEARIVKLVRAQYQRRGGYVRIFPSQNSWQKYSQYLDPVTGIPICSSTVSNTTNSFLIPHNYNLLVHSHVLPDFEKSLITHVDQPDRLKRYERTLPPNAANVVLNNNIAMATGQDVKQVKELIKNQLYKGIKLTPGECRRAFGMFMTFVLRKIANPKNDYVYHQAELVLRFLKRASTSLKMPYSTKTPSVKMPDKDRAAIIAKELNDFLFLYHRDTDLYTDTEDRENCISNMQFAKFIYGASEADLEDILLVVLRMERNQTPFLGDPVVPMCIDMPPVSTGNRHPAGRSKNTLLKHLACLTSVNSRRYRPPEQITQDDSSPNTTSPSSTSEDMSKVDML